MRHLRSLAVLFVLMLRGLPVTALEASFMSNAPCDLSGADTLLPFQVAHTSDGASYSIQFTLPPTATLDALHVVSPTEILFSVEGNPLDAGGRSYGQNEIVRYDAAGNLYTPVLCMPAPGLGLTATTAANLDALIQLSATNLVVSFEGPWTVAGVTYRPADLIEITNPSSPFDCTAWSVVKLYFDAKAAGVPIAKPAPNVTGAALEPGTGFLVLTFDVQVPLQGVEYAVGAMVRWDGTNFSEVLPRLFNPGGKSPAAYHMADFDFTQCPPIARVNPVKAVKSGALLSDVALTWPDSSPAGGYRVCRIDGSANRAEIALACASSAKASSLAGCDPTGAANCSDGAAPAPPVGGVYYYQVKGLCSGSEGA